MTYSEENPIIANALKNRDCVIELKALLIENNNYMRSNKIATTWKGRVKAYYIVEDEIKAITNYDQIDNVMAYVIEKNKDNNKIQRYIGYFMNTNNIRIKSKDMLFAEVKVAVDEALKEIKLHGDYMNNYNIHY